MSTQLERALALAERGFHVFPIKVGTKFPLISDWPNRATPDPAQITKWWTDPVLGSQIPYNIGVSTSRFGKFGTDVSDSIESNRRLKALLVVDIDVKGEANGNDTLLGLELEGKLLPPTLTVLTPSGGRHLYFACISPVKQGRNVLGPGVDIRSSGGQCVGIGSILEAGTYTLSFGDLSQRISAAPQWLVEQCGLPTEKAEREDLIDAEINQEFARDRATFYLRHEAPEALEGQAGDTTTFSVAARVRDFGLSAQECFELLWTFWNARCVPPWESEALRRKVENAYEYARGEIGSAAPEKSFETVGEAAATKALHPVEELNREYAFVIAGDGHHILWETTDVDKKKMLRHLSEATFHANLASKTIDFGDKPHPLSKVWMKDARRRSYKGICFKPGQEVDAEWYNLWTGFSVEPATKEEKCESLKAFLEHAKDNVCQGDENLFRWLIGYFAHLVQRPYEKPLVALVFRGSKGVGKNALVERIGYLLGNHALLASDRRYLTSNFNSHLENCLMLTLDEAFWSGDKESEGNLKSLITGSHHLVERKGKEPYKVDNCTRVIIIGNDDWLVPASEDERRFCVLDVGDGRKRDTKYFESMRKGMEAGGYRHLLRFLLNYDISDLNFSEAPETKGLLAQKVKSMGLIESWWFQCLVEGRLFDTPLEKWEEFVLTKTVRDSFSAFCKDRNVKSRLPTPSEMNDTLKKMSPSLKPRHTKKFDQTVYRVFRFEALKAAREEFDKFMGQAYAWPEDDSSDLVDLTDS